MSLASFFQRNRDRAVLLGCVAASLLLLSSPENLRFNLARTLGTVLYAPANGAVALGEHLARLRGENESLQERLMLLSDRLTRAEEAEKEAVRLRRLLDFRDTASYRFLPAELLSFPLTLRERDLVRIDRGRRDGVEPGMPVVSTKGLIGAVHSVGENQSQVRLLMSKNFAVSCRDRRSRVLGVLKWDPRRGFFVDRIDLQEDVVVGDRFMTSGLGVRFPEGFLLGSVVGVAERPGALRKEILLEPAVPIQTLEDVFVVTQVGEDAPGFPVPHTTQDEGAGGEP